VQLATVEVSSAQLLDLENTPVEIVADPGAGKAVFVLDVWSVLHFGTTPYTGNANLTIAPSYRGYSNFTANWTNILNKGFDDIGWWQNGGTYHAGSVNEYDHGDLVGSGWSMLADTVTTPLAGGDGTLTVYATYVVFDV
jgi:hypothetical protein